MVNATPNWSRFGQSPAAQKKTWEKGEAQRAQLMKEKGDQGPDQAAHRQGPAGRNRQHFWDNSIDALTWGAANPQIRAGVLRLLSTLPEVTVAKSTTGGQPTLTLTAGPALFDGGASRC